MLGCCRVVEAYCSRGSVETTVGSDLMYPSFSSSRDVFGGCVWLANSEACIETLNAKEACAIHVNRETLDNTEALSCHDSLEAMLSKWHCCS